MAKHHRLVSWNVNGIRAASQSEGWKEIWDDLDFDVLALQETKAHVDQLDLFLREKSGYQSLWHSAEKPGYSGVALYTRLEPVDVRYGLGDHEIDAEGRVITADFGKFTLVNAYFPNSQREHTRLPFKLRFCKVMHEYLEKMRAQGKTVYVCGDYNIAHQEIDLRNPKSNMKNAGFLPEERAWMDQFLKGGWVDAFRHFNKDPYHYTWWSYRPGVREKNIGWRLDYFTSNTESQDRMDDAKHLPQVFGSDHCPVVLDVKR
jgi:exodeoxyribonuclease-3